MRAAVAALLLCCACRGPAADDAALCRDVIGRLCRPPRCEVVTQTLKVGPDCEEDLLARTGCASDGFAFGDDTPSRDRVLECRLPLVRTGDGVTSAPSCADVEESFDRCVDLVRFLDGGTP